ncbi:MAG: DUF4974 domain-containing protein [Tannerella sp.]|jgi:ferric-dicitrate binding protein FerR (iron transport regulator)|nr:DUF4974 domain-containing protein [Tannerella sp.]
MQEEQYILITGYLQGILSKEETDAFFLWINADDANKELFFEIKAVYDASISTERIINIEKSWQRLQKKRKQNIPNIYRLWKKIASSAAVAAIAIGLTAVAFVLMTDRKDVIATCYIGGDGLEADVVVLPDETRVSLGSRTTFYCDPDYGKSQRRVFMNGEAYFEVSHQQDNPFIVSINGVKIEVLGTSFNIMAYPGDSLFITTLLEGTIRLTNENHQKSEILRPNQQYVYNRNTQKAQVYNVVAKNYIAWTSGYYYFSEQSLESILHRLSYVYGLTFDVRSEKLKNTLFTGTFYRGQSAKDLMEIINLSVPIIYKIEDRHVTIYT